jgi:hypothetical protein
MKNTNKELPTDVFKNLTDKELMLQLFDGVKIKKSLSPANSYKNALSKLK